MKEIIILGAGGHAKVIADIVLKNNFKLLGFLDDNVPLGTNILSNFDVIGKFSDSYQFASDNPNVEFVIGVGNNEVREKIYNNYNLKYTTVIHPTAIIGADVIIGDGTVIMPYATINAGAIIGNQVIINTASIVEHDNIISDFAHISPRAVLAGTVHVGKRTHIGVGAIIRNNITICDDVLVGAGAVVVKNIDKAGVYVGVPAKLKE